MRRPLASWSITQNFGENTVNYSQFGLVGHHGLDLAANMGIPIYAAETGTVEKSANGITDKYTGRAASGETITIVGQYETWYMHLSQRLVGAGQQVSEGQLIGYSGATGFVTGPHLHFGVRPLSPNINNGYRGFIDPTAILNQQGVTVMNPEAGTELYRTALFREPENAGAAGQWNGQTPAQALRSVRGPEWQGVKARLDAYPKLEQAIRDLQTALTNEKNKPPQTVEKLVEKIVTKNVEVIKEVPVYVENPQTQQKLDTIIKKLNSLWGLVLNLFRRKK